MSRINKIQMTSYLETFQKDILERLHGMENILRIDSLIAFFDRSTLFSLVKAEKYLNYKNNFILFVGEKMDSCLSQGHLHINIECIWNKKLL